MKQRICRLLLAAMWTTTFVLALMIADNLNKPQQVTSNGCSRCEANKKNRLVKTTNPNKEMKRKQK